MVSSKNFFFFMLDLLICSRQFFRLAAVRSVEDLELIGNELQLAALVS